MNPSDIYAVLQWWLVLFFIGACVAPITSRLFNLFFDKGYPFSKIVGLLLVGYTVFIVGTIRIAPFTAVTTVIVAIIWALVSYFFLPERWKFMFVSRSRKNQLFPKRANLIEFLR